MNKMLSNTDFYGDVPAQSSAVKRQVNALRKELLGLALEASDKPNMFHGDASPSVTIRIDTPVLRSQRPRQVISMTSKGGAMPCKFFPSVTTSKPPLPQPKQAQKPQTNFNLNRSLRRMSIAKKKLDRGVALAKASLFKTEPQAASPPRQKQKIERKKQAKAKKREIMRKALLFLKKYALSLKSLLKTSLSVGPKYHSPVMDRTRPPLPTLAKHDSYGRLVIPSGGSNNSTMSNSPEAEDKKKAEKKPIQPNVQTTVAHLPMPKREKKRRYTTPDEYPQADCGFNKTTFAAIEKLAFEPIIK